MPQDLEYPKIPASRAHRLSKRGNSPFVGIDIVALYDLYTIHSIINSSPVLHVSFNPTDPAQGPFPTILPMIGQMGSFAYPSADLDDTLDCYLHGYVTSRVMKLARESSEGLPICIAATKCDGLVSLTPFSHSYNYRSTVLFGYATPVDDIEEKIWAMELITNPVVPGRWENSRTPPDGAELSPTTILKVKIASGSGKVRDGGPHDEKKDLERSEVTKKIWTGVVPMWEVMGEPVASGYNHVGGVPQYLRSFKDKTNNTNESYAEKATRDA